MKRVLFLASTLGRSGPTNQLLNVLLHLDRTKIAPIILTLSPEPSDSRAADFRSAGIEVQSLGLGRVGGLLALSAFRSAVNKARPDVVHSHGIRSDVLSSRLPGGHATVATVHNLPQFDYSLTYGKVAGRVMTGVHAGAWRRMSALVGVSESVAKNLRDAFNLERVIAIPNGIDTMLFRPVGQTEKHRLRDATGLPVTPRIWISTGHLSERKNPLSLLRSWSAALGNSNYNVLVFLGDGPLRERCRQMAAGLSNVIFLGRKENVHDYVALADVFISASTAEGLPMAVLEAMASGLPVLLSDIPPHREIWEEDNNSGAVFPTGDEAALARLMVKFSRTDLASMAAASRGVAEHRFSAQGMAGEYEKLYERLPTRTV